MATQNEKKCRLKNLNCGPGSRVFSFAGLLLPSYGNLSSNSTRDTLACTTWHIKKQLGHKPLRKKNSDTDSTATGAFLTSFLSLSYCLTGHQQPKPFVDLIQTRLNSNQQSAPTAVLICYASFLSCNIPACCFLSYSLMLCVLTSCLPVLSSCVMCCAFLPCLIWSDL